MAKLTPEQVKTKMAQVDKDVIEGTRFYDTATAKVKHDGLPAARAEVDRMFESARMRHDKVHEAFTEAAQNDKELAKHYVKTVAAKKIYSAKWAAYRKLLGK